jgi:hypothetical protein
MKPLLFLAGRSFVNYCRRAVKSPQRLIGLLLIALYYGQYMLRYLFQGGPTQYTAPGYSGPAYNMPAGYAALHRPLFSLPAVEATIFWLFSLLTLMLFVTSLAPRATFRPADVEMLFPTPVSPKAVLTFKALRDGLTSLIFPLFFAAALLARPRSGGLGSFIQGFPDSGALALRLAGIAYILVAICFVAISYALSLTIYRIDQSADRFRKVFNAAMGLIAASTFGFILANWIQHPEANTLRVLSQNVVLRAIFLPATAATDMVISPLIHSPLTGLAGFAILAGVTAAALAVTGARIGFLYDQAAQRGAQTGLTRRQQQRGDVYAQAAEMARARKGKPPRTMRWLGRWSPTGPFALIWKDLILQSRGTMGAYVTLGMLMLIGILAMGLGVPSLTGLRVDLLIESAAAAWLFGMMASSGGFLELLRRGDLQKPLPFSAVQIVGIEVVSKAIPIFFITASFSVAATAVNWRIWSTALATAWMAPILSLPVLAVGLLVLLLFPDVDDAAQRSFRAFMTMLGSLIAMTPGLALAVGLSLLKVPLLIIALPFTVVCVVLAGFAVFFAATLYGSFNPAE